MIAYAHDNDSWTVPEYSGCDFCSTLLPRCGYMLAPSEEYKSKKGRSFAESALFLKPSSELFEKEILRHLRKISAIIDDDDLVTTEIEKFFSSILLPESFCFIQRCGNENNGDFNQLIEKFKHKAPLHNLFADFVQINS